MSSGGRQVIDLIVEEPSLVRIVINLRNRDNQVHALLYKPGSIDQDGKPLGRTDAVHNSMLVTVDPERRPY